MHGLLGAFQTGDKFNGFHGASLVLLFVAGVVAVVAIVIFALRWATSFPDLPAAGPETNDLGTESPAVVNLLVNRWHVTRAAVSATLVDLAARRVVGLEQVAPEQYVVRVKSAPTRESLTDYETQVLDLVQQKATGGSAPIAALDAGAGTAADRWFGRFTRSVEAEARKLGLARNRWKPIDWAIFAGGLALALGLCALAFGVAHFGEGLTNSRNSSRTGRWDWFYVAIFVEIIVLVGIKSLRGLRDTKAGRAACARWLGVRKFLRHDGTFGDAPPASVQIWQRYLSYGVALGVAHATATALPFEREDPRHAWSRYGGNWHQVRVDYPKRFGYGDSPIGVFLGGIVRALFWGGLAFVVVPLAIKMAWSAQRDLLSGETSLVAVGFVAAFVLIFGFITIQLVARAADGVIRLERGVRDLGSEAEVRGVVIRIDEPPPWSGYVAVDDGQASVTKAFRIASTSGLPTLGRGDEVAVTYTPHLRHVKRVDVVAANAAPAPLSVDPVVPSSHGLDGCDAAAIGRIVGLTMQQVDPPNVPPGTAARAFIDGGEGHVMVATGNTGSRAVATIARALVGHGGTAVSGFAGPATWNHNRLVVNESGGDMLLVIVDVPHLTDEQRGAAAIAIAHLAVSAPA